VSPKDTARFQRLKSFEMSYEQFEKLSKEAKQLGLIFISTPLDLKSARFLGTFADAIKISSGDNTFFPLIEECAFTAKPLIVSTGLATRQEIFTTQDFIRSRWRELGADPGLAMLHCVTSYPVAPEEANLRAITSMIADLQKCVIGYSDHTVGLEAATFSVALGARIVEKHFTIDKNYSDFRDHQISADPFDLSRLVERIDLLNSMLGDGTIGLRKCEVPAKESIRRSIVAAKNLPAGHIIASEDLIWLRPSGYYSPGEEHRLIGRKLARDVARAERFSDEHFSRAISP